MKTTSSVGLVVVLTIAAAGCGSSKATTSATTAAAAATTAAAAAATTAAPAATTAAEATTAAPATTAAATAETTQPVEGASGSAVTTAKAATAVGKKDITIAVITNGDGGEFWGKVQQGVEQAGRDLGIKVIYEGANNNAGAQAKLLNEAVTNKVSGIALSVADPKAFTDGAARAKSAQIPLVTLNSGVEQFVGLGAITHVGQSERDAGRGAGDRMKSAGGKVMLCVRPDTSVGQVARCQGAAEAFAPGKVVELVTPVDADASQAAVRSALSSDASIDTVLATSAGGAVLAQKIEVELNKKAVVGAIDLSGPLLDGIEQGDIAFTIDQQQYTQGYLSVVVLYLNLANPNAAVGGQPISTGPSFVDKTNVVAVKELFAKRP